jgi:hypothetical protein
LICYSLKIGFRGQDLRAIAHGAYLKNRKWGVGNIDFYQEVVAMPPPLLCNTRFIEQRLVRVALGEVLGQQEPLLVVVLALCGQLGDLGERRQEQVQTSVPREEEQLVEEPLALAHKFLVSLKNVEVLSS